MEKELRNEGSPNSKAKRQHSTPSVWTEKALLKRLAKGPEARAKFVESQINKGIVFQIRGLRAREGWSQPKLADEIETSQNQIYRLENLATSKPTISTLKKIAAAFDVALVVRFVPFSQLVKWVSAKPFVDKGLATESLIVPSFEQEMAATPPDQESVNLVYQEPFSQDVFIASPATRASGFDVDGIANVKYGGNYIGNVSFQGPDLLQTASVSAYTGTDPKAFWLSGFNSWETPIETTFAQPPLSQKPVSSLGFRQAIPIQAPGQAFPFGYKQQPEVMPIAS